MTRSRLHARGGLCLAGVVAALGLSTLACTIDVGGPQPPGPPIPTSEAALQQITEIWKGALASAAGTGKVTVILDETQLTSLVASRLAARSDAVLREPQVYLRQGQIQIFGVAQQGSLRARVLLSITPVINPDGTIAFNLTAADLGPLPAPDSLKSSLSAVITEAFTGSLGSLATGIRITSIAIDEGKLALVGELR